MELFQKLYRTTTLLFSCGKILDFTDFQHSHVVSKYWVTDSFSFSILSYSRFRVLKARGTQVTFFFLRFICLLYYLLTFFISLLYTNFLVCELLSGCSAWASHFSGSSCCRAWVSSAQASVVAAYELSSCDS